MSAVPWLLTDEAVEVLYALLDDDGWADHRSCGWVDDQPPDDGMCGKEWQERASVRDILAALHQHVAMAAKGES